MHSGDNRFFPLFVLSVNIEIIQNPSVRCIFHKRFAMLGGTGNTEPLKAVLLVINENYIKTHNQFIFGESFMDFIQVAFWL
jgi:hypothetical protein